MVLMVALASGLAGALLAKRKNRNPVLWGMFGFLMPVLALVVLAFSKYLCPQCGRALSNANGQARTCSGCGKF